jgi:hypothetical protein
MPAAKKAAPKPAAPAPPPAEPEQPPTTTEVPSPPVDPETYELDQYLSADPVHEAYETGQFCSTCGAAVKTSWKACPLCGGNKAVDSSRRPKFAFKEAKAKYKPNPPPQTVTVTPVEKTAAEKA